MRYILEEMYDLLLEQKELQEQLLELSREKGQVIIESKTARLEEIVRAELKLLSAVKALEKKRENLAPAVGTELSIESGDITVSAIIEKAAPDEREPFMRLRQELTMLLKLQSERNSANQELIQAHLEYADAILGLMVDSEDPLNNFYGNDGKQQEDRKKSSGIFDAQI